MQEIIAKMVEDFENGRLSRRQLIQALATAVAGATGLAAAPPAPPASGGFKTLRVNHISYQVADYRKTRDFYVDLMGMEVDNDNGTNQCYLYFNDKKTFLLPRNRRQAAGQPVDPNAKPVVDHIAYEIENWDTEKVKAELLKRGLTPRLDTGLPGYGSFHITDPDGYDLQLEGLLKPGDKGGRTP